MEDEIIFFDKTIHLNWFLYTQIKVGEDPDSGDDINEPLDLEGDTFSSWKDGLYLSIDGSIMGVDADLIRPYISEPLVRSVRLGQSKMPKEFSIANKGDFYRYLAIKAPLSQI